MPLLKFSPFLHYLQEIERQPTKIEPHYAKQYSLLQKNKLNLSEFDSCSKIFALIQVLNFFIPRHKFHHFLRDLPKPLVRQNVSSGSWVCPGVSMSSGTCLIALPGANQEVCFPNPPQVARHKSSNSTPRIFWFIKVPEILKFIFTPHRLAF